MAVPSVTMEDRSSNSASGRCSLRQIWAAANDTNITHRFAFVHSDRHNVELESEKCQVTFHVQRFFSNTERVSWVVITPIPDSSRFSVRTATSHTRLQKKL